MDAVHGNDIALGVEIAVLALPVVLRPEEVGLRALHVVLVAEPLAHQLVGVGVGVGHAPLEDLGLVGQVAVLVLGDVDGLAQLAVGDALHHVVVIGGHLHGVGDGAVEHGVLGGVAGGHVVPGVEPLGLVVPVGGLRPGVGQVVPLGDDVAVVAAVVGHRGDAQGLAAAHQVLGQQIVLKVGLVGGIAGLALEGLHPAVELGEADRVPLGDQPGHVLGLGLGLEGVVPVEVKAAGGGTGQVGPALHVLLGDDDEEHVGEQLVHVHRHSVNGVVFLQLHLGGDGGGGAVGVLAFDVAQVGGVIGHQIGDGHGALLTRRAHLLGQLGLTGGGEAGELVVVDGAALRGRGLHQHPGKGQDAVAGGHLIGVNIGVHDGHLVVAQGAALQLLQQGGGIALRLRLDLLPLIHRGLVLGHNQIRHIQAFQAVVALALAHGELLHVEVSVAGGVVHQRVQLVIDLRHGVEVVVGRHLQIHRAQGLAVQPGGQREVAAHIHIGAAVAVGHTEIVTEVALVGEGDGQVHLAVHRLGGGGHVGKEGGLAVLAQPGAQGTTLGLVGKLGIVQVIRRVRIGRQGPGHGGGGLLGLGLGHVHRDAGLEGPLGGQGDAVAPAVTAGVLKHSGGGRCAVCGRRRDDAQGQEQRRCRQHGQRVAECFVLLHALHLTLSSYSV